VGARSDLDLDGLAYRLEAARLETPMFVSFVGAPGAEHAVEEVAPSSSDFYVCPFNVRQLALTNGGGMGLALVSPHTLKKTELDEAVHLLRMSPGPLLGVITYTPRAGHAVSNS
jgi:hypothetical protein